MANRRTNQFYNSLIPKLKAVFGKVTFGASGAVASFSGNGVASVTKLGTGLYQIMMQDNYYKFLRADFLFESPVTGSNINGGSFVAGTLYQITALGTTTVAQWHTAGVPAGIVPAVGVCFVALGVGAGTGTVKAISNSNIPNVEVAQSAQLGLNNTSAQIAAGGSGSIFIVQCLNAGALTSPTSGAIMDFEFLFQDTALQA